MASRADSLRSWARVASEVEAGLTVDVVGLSSTVAAGLSAAAVYLDESRLSPAMTLRSCVKERRGSDEVRSSARGRRREWAAS